MERLAQRGVLVLRCLLNALVQIGFLHSHVCSFLFLAVFLAVVSVLVTFSLAPWAVTLYVSLLSLDLYLFSLFNFPLFTLRDFTPNTTFRLSLSLCLACVLSLTLLTVHAHRALSL